MQETLNYIKVLGWGYGGFCGSFENIAPLSLSQDFESSLEQIEKRLAVVDGLNYGALIVEATSPNGKANLEKYRSVEDSTEYSLHFVRDRKALLEKHIPTMYDGFKRIADQYKADGIWTIEQYAQYKGALNELEKGFEVRLKEFCAAYDYKLGDDPNQQTAVTEPQQEQIKPTRRKGRPTEPFASKMINDADGKKLKKIHTISQGKMGKDFALIIWACIEKGWCNKPTYTQVRKEFGNIGSSTGYNRYLSNGSRMFTQQEKDGVLKSLD